MKERTHKRIILTMLLSIVILGQAFGVSAAAQWRDNQRRYRRANGVVVANVIRMNGRHRGWNDRRELRLRYRRHYGRY
jgi:hypothetical protein